jgi:hypothetical protein
MTPLLPGEGHVVEVEKCCSVGEDGVYVDLLDVGDMTHRVARHVQVTHVLKVQNEYAGRVVLFNISILIHLSLNRNLLLEVRVQT